MSAAATLPSEQSPNASGVQFLYADAHPVAQRFIAFLERYCTRVAIAGSLRRRKQRVSDIEILFISKPKTITDPGDMFGAKRTVRAVDGGLDVLLELGVIEKRPNIKGHFTWGAENKLAIHTASGIPVDFFATTEANWWNALVVRTGPAASNKRIASEAIKRGWNWHAYGDGFTRGDRKSATDRFSVTSERDVFEHVGLDYLFPQDR